MPYKKKAVKAELALTHKGVDIYHIYKDDDVSLWKKIYHFGYDKASTERYSFDVRDLSVWTEPAEEAVEDVHIKNVLKAAIETGELQPYLAYLKKCFEARQNPKSFAEFQLK